MTPCERCNGIGYIALCGDEDIVCPKCDGNTNKYPSLDDLLPLFPTKAEAKRYRKQVIEYVNECQKDFEEIASETVRIRNSFLKREPAILGDDFLARWHYLTNGGTAIRRNRKRELKRQKSLRSVQK